MGIYISLVIASFLFIYNILYIFLSFKKTYYYILLDIVPYIVVMKLSVNKGIVQKKKYCYGHKINLPRFNDLLISEARNQQQRQEYV